jgi:DtxR family Mn-dependent transcriptional regulator
MKESTVLRPLSVSRGDYLKVVWELAGDGAASATDIADRLGVRPASVTNMLGRLREMGLVEHERYRGASLTQRGRKEALRLVRRHRLIETFLLEYLGYPWQEVHQEAQKLEHGLFDEGFVERLAEHLGYPRRDPYGAPIPNADGTSAPEARDRPLSEVPVGQRVVIRRVRDEDASALRYLRERRLMPGRFLMVRESRDIDGLVTVEDEEGDLRSLGKLLADSIFVQSLSASRDRRKF